MNRDICAPKNIAFSYYGGCLGVLQVYKLDAPFDPELHWSGTVDLRFRDGEFPGPPEVTQVVPRYQQMTPR